MTYIVTALASLAMLASAALAGVLLAQVLAQRIKRFDDGPEPRDLNPLWALAVVLALGLVLLFRHTPPLQFFYVALASVPLVTAWYVDAKTGIVPDWCTLLPLAVVLAVVIRSGHWVSLFSAFVVFVPFAISALFSRGRGMGWGDVKLATFCSSLVGMMVALPAFAVACLVATFAAYRRDGGKRPIAFGPYLVVATFAAMAVTVSVR
jgi:prepilin signal peptidase PulO-like enzyme (type II secretory pathway)